MARPVGLHCPRSPKTRKACSESLERRTVVLRDQLFPTFFFLHGAGRSDGEGE